MAKRPDKGHDATQDVSISQLVPSERPVLRRNNPKNDMSLWAGDVVAMTDFSPPAPTKPVRSNRWKWIAAGLALVGAVLAFVLVTSAGGKSPETSKAVTPAPIADAAVAVTKPDAAAVAVADAGVTVDAGPTVVAVNGQADAISGVGPIIKAAKKKGLRKTPPKKKTTAKKKRK
jgi:hypothetical protein